MIGSLSLIFINDDFLIFNIFFVSLLFELKFSVIFLLLTTFVTLYVTKAILLEQKIVNNEVRSKLAFEAAEYGLSVAMQYISENPDRDGNGAIDPIFTLVDNVGTTNTSSVGNQSVEVTITDINNMLAFQIESQGFSDDKVATRTITQIIQVIDALPNAPDNPFTSRGAVTIGGSANIYNPEGNSTIWSGGDVSLGGNATIKSEIADPTDANYPSCMDTPMSCELTSTVSESTLGLDVIEQDGNLANLTAKEMFENFFGTTPSVYKESRATVLVSTSGELDSASTNNEIIWYEGDAAVSANTVIGCSSAENVFIYSGSQKVKTCPVANEAPSILIINGDLKVTGSPSFYGIVFVMGKLSGGGTPNFHGSVVVAGDLSGATGSFSVWYNSRVLESVRTNSGFSSASGAWKDF